MMLPHGSKSQDEMQIFTTTRHPGRTLLSGFFLVLSKSKHPVAAVRHYKIKDEFFFQGGEGHFAI